MTNKATTTGVNGIFLLGLLFVGLKLTGHIDWSWWWVTLPFWGGLAFVAALLVIVLAVSMAVAKFSKD